VVQREHGDGVGYETVRRKLIERGYLDSPIERFLLGGALSAGSRSGRMLRTAARAAILGGPLLGALLAAAAAAANRPRVGAADFFLLWLYFAPFGAAALFLLDFIAAAAVTAIARGARTRPDDSIRAAVLVGAPTLAYLLLLWWQRPTSGLLEDALFLVLAALCTATIGWLAGVVSLSGVIGRNAEIPDRRKHRILFSALAIAPVLIGLAVAHTNRREIAPAPEVEVAPTGGKLLWVGIDGLDADAVQAFEPRGVLEQLLGAMARGSVFSRRPAPLAQPPEVWTTLLTGMPPSAHGVRSIEQERLPGVATPLNPNSGPLPLTAALRFLLPTRTVPTSGESRSVRTLWEIGALARPTLSVGWWTSWPASEDSEGALGYCVTDRLLPKLLSGAPADRDTAPAALHARLNAEFEADRESIRGQFDARFSPSGSSEVDRWLWDSYLIDAWSWRVTRRLLADPKLHSTYLYLPGLDILRHRLEQRRTREDVADLLQTQAALESYLSALDGIVEEIVTTWNEGSLVLVADPGRRNSEEHEGFVLVLGPHSIPACVDETIDDLELAPLALALSGYPLSEEMLGSVPTSRCLTGLLPSGTIASYGTRRPPSRFDRSDYDPQMLERLKSLGYLN